MTEQPPIQDLHPSSGARSVRVWSPVTVAVYAVVLAFPSALVLAAKNWQALGQRRRILPHIIGAIVLSISLIALLILRPQLARGIAFALNLSAFAYFREKLKVDVAAFTNGNPEVVLQIRPWYSAIGWATLGMVAFLLLTVPIVLMLAILGFEV